MEDFLLFLILIDAFDLLESQSVLIENLSKQRDDAIALAQRANEVSQTALALAGIK